MITKALMIGSISKRVLSNISRRLFYPEPSVVLGLFIILFGPEFLNPFPRGFGYGHPHTMCMTEAEYYLTHEPLCDSEFPCNLRLAFSGPHKKNSDVNRLHGNIY